MSKSTVSLRVFGDDLQPDEISRLLGCAPDSSYRNGDPVFPGRAEHKRRRGMWSIKAAEIEPEAYDSQIQQLLLRVSPDESVWRSLRERYEIDLFCGFFMDTRNQGFSISIESLAALAARGIEPGFDIYAPTQEEEEKYYAMQSGA